MRGQKFTESKCRICWTEDEGLDWNNLISNDSGLTYRDCFYKYTQLECIDMDSFSNMICHNCSNGLEFIDAFISNAIETNTKLQEMLGPDSMNSKEKIVASRTDSEPMCVEEIEIKEEGLTSIFYEEEHILNTSENSFEQTNTNLKDKGNRNTKEINDVTHKSDLFLSDDLTCENKAEKEIRKKTQINEKFLEETVGATELTLLVRQLRKYYFELPKSPSKKCEKRSNEKSLDKISNEEGLTENFKVKVKQLKSTETDKKNFDKIETPSQVSTNRIAEKVLVGKTKANKTNEQIFLCQYCSAEIKGLHKLRVHEAKHNEVRTRTETCVQCGVKFYNKHSLRLHEKIHNVNREKKFKCEFCEKAFYNMGGLNVHKRIHLGLMVKCQICSKEFFRNVELYKHMNCHSSTLINVEVKKRSRYFVRCRHCGKKILSTSFKSHTAAHLNQPLVKCSICNKEYFNRESCRHHIRTIHMKNPETVNDYVVLLKTDRLTHLYIRQNADVEPEEK